MFLECTPGCIVAACQARYIRETQLPFEADGLSIGQTAEACGLTIGTFRYGERAGLTLWPTPCAASDPDYQGAWLASMLWLKHAPDRDVRTARLLRAAPDQ